MALVVGGFGFVKARETPIGDAQAGVPELRPDSRYNLDSELITSKFSIGTDILNVSVETRENGCINHRIIDAIDRLAWRMANVQGVRDVLGLAGVSKVVSAGWSEGSLKWRNLPREELQLVQAQGCIDTSSGLLNADCSMMPVMLFPAITAMCLVSFRSVAGTMIVIIPLALGSIPVYTMRAVVGIGLKVNTLPMVALGAGIAIDYGNYLFTRMQELLRRGASVQETCRGARGVTGAAIIFTGFTRAIGVGAWAFSPLQFQADVGLMLTFMFLVSVLGAMLLLPALAAWIMPRGRDAKTQAA